MANEQNLMAIEEVNSRRTREEHSEDSRKAGIASGEARRKRRTLKEELLLMLEDEEIQKSLTASLIREAIDGNKAGSCTKAFEVIRDTIGEKEADKVEMNGGMGFYLDGIGDDISG